MFSPSVSYLLWMLAPPYKDKVNTVRVKVVQCIDADNIMLVELTDQ